MSSASSPNAKSPSSGKKTSSGAGHKSIFDKLTDTKLYTGAHKHRFDDSGKGRGLAGRDAASGIEYGGSKVNDISQILRPNFRSEKATVPLAAFQVSTTSQYELDKQSGKRVPVTEGGSGSNSPKKSPAAAKSPSLKSPSASSGTSSAGGSKLASPSSGAPKKSPSSSSGGKHKSIFDKLTDTTLYTGAHKHRFDGTGRGRGMAGRDAASGIEYGGGAVHSISSIMRPNLK